MLDLELNLGDQPTTPSGDLDLSHRVHVPNVFPTVLDMPYRIALIGEAPGQEEETHKTPFIGPSGHLLNGYLVNANILRNACFVGNICSVRPPGNEITKFDWFGNEIQTGLRTLKAELAEYKPNLVVLLGNSPLRAAKGEDEKISEWRGSFFTCTLPGSPFENMVCLPIYHPAFCLRNDEEKPLFGFDLKKARRQGEKTVYTPPVRHIEYDLTADELCYRMDNWQTGCLCSIDIEGVLGNWSCIGLADTSHHAIIIHWMRFTLDEHMRLVRSLSALCWRLDVPKVLQASLYDNFVMTYGYKILIRNVTQDTMLKGWEIYCELPKGLDTQASIYTDQPQWKYLIAYSIKERKKRALLGVDPETEKRNKWIANGIDCSVTREICTVQDNILDGTRLDHYRLNVQLLQPLLYMELRGICYDVEKAKQRLNENAVSILEQNLVLKAQTGREININSPKQLCEYFYRTKGFEPIYKKEHGRNTDRLTTDVEALLTLHKKYSDPAVATVLALRRLDSTRETLEVTTDPDGRVRCGYNIVGTDTGRLTCYGSPTGSGANLQTITEDLRDLYTADPGHHFFQCDLAGADGWTVAVRCKLLGDSTMYDDYVAGIKPAKVIALMYDTLKKALELHGFKKAFEIEQLKQRVLVAFATMDRQKLFEACDAVKKASWIYFASKRVQHGCNYGMGPNTMSSQILKDSYKKEKNPIFFPVADCKLLQSLYMDGRYKGLRLWQRWVENELLSKGRLTACSGQVRIFFGRKKTMGKTDLDTLKAALSHEPQANTTYATNLAMQRLWTDPANRIGAICTDSGVISCSDGSTHRFEKEALSNLLRHSTRLVPGGLIIEPLHTVHDALCGQFPIELTEWARAKVKSYFNNQLTIDGYQFVIPFEGHYGHSWGEQEHTL